MYIFNYTAPSRGQCNAGQGCACSSDSNCADGEICGSGGACQGIFY